MAPWKARFRYAHSYIVKSWFEGAEDDLPEPSTKLVTSAPRELPVVVPPQAMTIICVACQWAFLGFVDIAHAFQAQIRSLKCTPLRDGPTTSATITR